MEVRPLTGDALAAVIPDIARLRITVFWEFPYLYEGDEAYERDYLQSYVESDRSVVIGAFDDGCLVGAATGTPMEDHADDFAAPFAARGYDLARIFYCAESVLMPRYRGRGLGHAFFDGREAHARAQGFQKSAFCAVIRPSHHPMRPQGYRPLDGFWRKRGYAPLEGVIATFHWKTVGADAQSAHDLQFWMKDL